MSTNERWLPIAGLEGSYSVSSHGRVRSEARIVLRGEGVVHTVRQRILALAKKRSGHLMVVLHGADKLRPQLLVHRLVLIAFAGPPPTPLHECAHNDGKPANNRIENLRWATRAENHHDKVAHGTHNRGEWHPHCKVSDDTVRRIRASTAAINEIAAELGMDYRYVWAIKTERTRRYS